MKKVELTEPQFKLLIKMVERCKTSLDDENTLRFVASTGYVDYVYDRMHENITKKLEKAKKPVKHRKQKWNSPDCY